MRILLVDDDDVLTQQLSDFLVSQRYAVDIALDGEAGWDYAQAATYDLIVLDINLPKLNGLHLCQRLRQTQYPSPILLLTAQGDSSAKVVGLDAGADDYLVKPCTLSELSARIRALLRRPINVSSPLLQSGGLCLNTTTCEVTYHDQPLPLSPKEYGLLELFLRHPQRIFSSTAILEHLWNFEDTPGEETVRTHIKRLRRKLKSVGADTLIDTIYGMGYRLKSPADSSAPAVIEAAPPLAPGDEARQAASALWEKFKPAMLKRLASLDQVVVALRLGALPDPLRQAAAMDAHKLAGSLGMFGFAEGSRLSQVIEQWLKATAKDSSDSPEFESLVTALHAELEKPFQPLKEPLSPPPAAIRPRLPSWIKARTQTAGDSPSVKVLALDDDAAILEALELLLPRWGIMAITLSDPLQLWTVLASEMPDLLILDVDMPAVSGIDICTLIRDSDLWNGLPILFLTAHREPEIILSLYRAGADDYVPKPFTEPEVITRIFNRIERQRLLQTWRKPTAL